MTLATATLLTLIRDAIASDADLSQWCYTKYGRRPTVCVGVDMENPPGAADYPVVVIEDITETRGNAQNILSWVVSIGVGIMDETITTAAVTTPGAKPEDDPVLLSTTKTLAGLSDVETFREQIEALLVRSRFAKITFTTESAAINLYPEFNAFTFATIEQIHTRRR